jgi:predicted AlkP superfamily phosphohydrolase/phosphomutase
MNLLVRTIALMLIALPALAAEPRQKVIVLGFDGVDARLTEQWMEAGELPNLARLRESGTYRPLRPTLPAQTPVSWSTFSTGLDPGRTGIFDFLRRDPETYMPLFAAFDEISEPFVFGRWNAAAAAGVAFLLFFLLLFGLFRLISARRSMTLGVALTGGLIAALLGGWWAATFLPVTRPGVVNRQQGTPMWEVAAAAGLRTRVVHVPVTFPAHEIEHGHLLAGLGVPDISGRVGKPYYFTSELNFRSAAAGANEFSIEVVELEDNRGVIETTIIGPPNRLFGEPKYITSALTLTVAEDRRSLGIRAGDHELTLRPGEWSDWVTFEFRFNRFIRLRGISRFFLSELEPEIKLYLSPINFDPRALPPGFNISAPRRWAAELARQFGPYKTMGWAIDTWAVSEGFATEQMFWDDMEWTVDQYSRMFRQFLEEETDLYVHCFEFPDRVGHVLWRLSDEEHPAWDAELAAQWSDGILRSYRMMDQIVGEAMAAADRSGAALIVLSDHGFATWRRSINYNTWLVQNGYLALRSGVEAGERSLELLFDQGQFWENVDWSRTRAYAMGLGNVYINLRGREAEGIVEPGREYEQLKLELKTKMEQIIDPENGERPVSRVVSREEAYRSFDPNMIPDLFVTNNPGYRVSWQTSLGGIQRDLFETNERVWSGDHCSLDPDHVNGIFFMNRRLTTGRQPYIADIYPTVLDLLQLEPPYELDGVALR